MFESEVYQMILGRRRAEQISAHKHIYLFCRAVTDGPGLTPSSVNVPAELPGQRGRVIQKTAVLQTDRQEDPGPSVEKHQQPKSKRPRRRHHRLRPSVTSSADTIFRNNH